MTRYHTCIRSIWTPGKSYSPTRLSRPKQSASKVWASMYWRSKIWGRNFGLKLKFYYTNRPLGTRKWHQNLNWTPNKTFLLVKVMTDWSIPENRLKSLIKMSHFVSNSNSDAIFVFPGVDLYNRILISSQNSDLGFSTSSTMRPKLQRPWGRPRMDLGGWNLAWDLRVGPYSKYVWGKAVRAFSKNSARPSVDSIFMFKFPKITDTNQMSHLYGPQKWPINHWYPLVFQFDEFFHGIFKTPK